MQKYVRKTLNIISGIIIAILLLFLAVFVWMYVLYEKSDLSDEQLTVTPSDYRVAYRGDSLRTCRSSLLRLNSYGIWEAELKGSPAELGACMGALSSDLLYYQEKVFVDQIRRLVPSESQIRLLRNFIVIFNRNIKDFIRQEYRDEIYALSRFCTHDFDLIGSPYFRQLNYHAAHDIGHLMQQYMLVGCSSFSTWGKSSEDASLLVGRNFDFYMGEDFARNKILLFISPEKGYRYASMTWAGMTGVLSGMNEKGLCVTINASKGSIPTSAACPISLLAREILQYAENIEEAYGIAARTQTFVSESLLIGSAADGHAAIIEKTPHRTVLFRSDTDCIACTNHFQSETFQNDRHNRENIENSDSRYRLDRLKELISRYAPLSEEEAVRILRDRKGLHDADIGFTNQKSINLSIAHHSVVFKPEELKMWISTGPWQSGAFLCYDLGKIFSDRDSTDRQGPLHDRNLTLGADTAFLLHDYADILKYRELYTEIRNAVRDGERLEKKLLKEAVELNPNYFEIYDICGDYMATVEKEKEAAVICWKMALTKEIPHTDTVEKIKQKIRRNDKR